MRSFAEKIPHCEQKSRCKSIWGCNLDSYLAAGSRRHQASISERPRAPSDQSALLLNRTRHLVQNITHTRIQYPRSGVWNNEQGGNKEKRVSGRLVLITCKTHQRAFFAPAGILIAAHYQIAEDARACTSFSLSLCEWPIMRRRRRLLWSTMLIRTWSKNVRARAVYSLPLWRGRAAQFGVCERAQLLIESLLMIACEAVIELKENTASRAQPGFDSQKRTPSELHKTKKSCFWTFGRKNSCKATGPWPLFARIGFCKRCDQGAV